MKYNKDDFNGWCAFDVDGKKAVVGLDPFCNDLNDLKRSGFQPIYILVVSEEKHVGTRLLDAEKYFRMDVVNDKNHKVWHKGDGAKFVNECVAPLSEKLKTAKNSCVLEETIGKLDELKETLEMIESITEMYYVRTLEDGSDCTLKMLYSDTEVDKDGIKTIIGVLVD